jgi:carbohydrate-binding DOMON domain-containing protein
MTSMASKVGGGQRAHAHTHTHTHTHTQTHTHTHSHTHTLTNTLTHTNAHSLTSAGVCVNIPLEDDSGDLAWGVGVVGRGDPNGG